MSCQRLFHPQSFFGSFAALLATTLIHRRWKTAAPGTTVRGILDIACHLGTACAVTLPVLPNARNHRGFGAVALGSAVALDIDHIVAARSFEVNSWMTMPSRPPTHSLAAMIAMAWGIESLAPGRRLWLAVALGVGSHLLRDLATGGAPLWHPRRVISWPVHAVLVGLVILPLLGWFLAGMPVRPPRHLVPRRSR